MIKHIVMLRLKDEARGATKNENIRKLKSKLEALTAFIPEIRKLEIGINFKENGHSSDFVLITEFEDLKALEIYTQHPEHQKVIAFIQCVITERRFVDYEI